MGVTNHNLATTTGCAGLKLRFCADKPEGGTQTGPMQVGGDWTTGKPGLAEPEQAGG